MYYSYFTENNRDKATSMFFEECIKESSGLSGRLFYNRLCVTVCEFGKCYGLDEALKITECLKVNHRRQPAFIDELCTAIRKLEHMFHKISK